MTEAPSQGNQAKYHSYRLAHDRMNAAIEAGFPLEAIAIAESLLTDRLLSFANAHGAGFEADRVVLGKAARKVEELCQAQKDAEGEALAQTATEWANERNVALHAIAKSGQGDGPPVCAESFVAHADAVAKRGVELVKTVKAWHQKRLRAAGK